VVTSTRTAKRLFDIAGRALGNICLLSQGCTAAATVPLLRAPDC
jgi:hypothetical protein